MNSVIRQLREGYHRIGSFHYLEHLCFAAQVLLLVDVNAQTISNILDSTLLNELCRLTILLRQFQTCLVVVVHLVESFSLIYFENSRAVNRQHWLLYMSDCNSVLFLLARSEADDLRIRNVDLHSFLNNNRIAEIPK